MDRRPERHVPHLCRIRMLRLAPRRGSVHVAHPTHRSTQRTHGTGFAHCVGAVGARGGCPIGSLARTYSPPVKWDLTGTSDRPQGIQNGRTSSPGHLKCGRPVTPGRMGSCPRFLGTTVARRCEPITSSKPWRTSPAIKSLPVIATETGMGSTRALAPEWTAKLECAAPDSPAGESTGYRCCRSIALTHHWLSWDRQIPHGTCLSRTLASVECPPIRRGRMPYRAKGIPLSATEQPPLRAPHHQCTAAGLLGTIDPNGNWIPGELSLAHRGLLCLDELCEFSRDCIEALRGKAKDSSFHGPVKSN